MRHAPFMLPVVVLTLLGLLSAGTLAQEGGPPPPDATPGRVGVSGAVLGGIEPVAAPGFRLEISETTWEPGSYVTRHTHPLALVVCVKEGALGFAIHEGAATLTRGGTGDSPEATEPLELETEVVLEPRDCIAFDEFAAHTIHSAWSASDEPTVTWEADLVQIGEPFTTFVDEMGTPVP
jgi:hypothetical protein